MSVRSSLVLMILGEDQPGVIEKVSLVVRRHQGNWLESQMAGIAGYFGGLVHISIPANEVGAVVEKLQRLEGLTVIAKEGRLSAGFEAREEVELELIGQDRPGIVNLISESLASRGVNVEELETQWESAPMSGTELFKARARLSLPPEVSPGDIRSDLEKIASDLMVDLTVRKLREPGF